MKKSLNAFTLIEMIIIITIIGILAGMAIVNLTRLKPVKDLVDDATNIISEVFSQVALGSVNTDVVKEICSITSGTGNNRASCNLNSASGSTDFKWLNINNNSFGEKVTMSIKNSNNNQFITKISYAQGLIKSIRYLNDSNDTIINTQNESIISPILITVSAKSSPDTCFNTIKLWPNNVIDVVENCARAG